MKSPQFLNRALRLLAILGVGFMLLPGCRSIFGLSEFFTILAGGSISAPSPLDLDASIGAGGSITNVTADEVGDPLTVSQALADLANTRAKLLALRPQVPVTSAQLLAGPVAPGFYLISGSLSIPAGGSITLNGDGIYVFNITGGLQVGANSTIVADEDVSPSNVMWNVGTTANIGAGAEFGGIVIAEGNIDLASGAELFGRLLSRNGNVTIASDDITDPIVGSGFPPTLELENTSYTVAPGETVTFPIVAGFTFPFDLRPGGEECEEPVDEDEEPEPFGEVALFVSDLPTGATHTYADPIPDQDGPNDSDFLLEDVVTELDDPFVETQFSWTPTVPGTYQFTYFARSNSFFDIETFNGPIDACTVTIQVGLPTSTAGTVAGSGSWGPGRTLHLTATSRGGARPRITGAFRATLEAGSAFRARTLSALVRETLEGNRKSATLYGMADTGRYGLVPYRAVFVDGGGRRTDTVTITLNVDGSNLEFTGSSAGSVLIVR
jgi:hypothetical protein